MAAKGTDFAAVRYGFGPILRETSDFQLMMDLCLDYLNLVIISFTNNVGLKLINKSHNRGRIKTHS